jgi:hypothetical protein
MMGNVIERTSHARLNITRAFRTAFTKKAENFVQPGERQP